MKKATGLFPSRGGQIVRIVCFICIWVMPRLTLVLSSRCGATDADSKEKNASRGAPTRGVLTKLDGRHQR